MNKNTGNVADPIPGHPPNRSNINIQINFNMKDKTPGFVGKKIDNYVQIPVKKQGNAKNVQSGKKLKKKGKQLIQKQTKPKNTNISNDSKAFERTKNYKNNSNEKTPERRSISRKDQRSKSTNNKALTRKNAKSVQNIKAVKYIKNKSKSPVSSQQRQRSHSKSSKKLIKTQKQSLKSLYTFANTTLKNKINKSKTSNSRQRQISVTNKNKEDNNDKIKDYMQERKKKDKLQRGRIMKEEKIKKQKIANELKKVEIERKANASKSFVGLKKNEQKQERFPMYFMDDQDKFQEQSSYNQLRKQVEEIIHNSPPLSNYIEAIPIKKIHIPEKHQSSSSKKQNKSSKVTLVHKYLNGTINTKQLEELTNNLVKIQSTWRGYNSRKKMFRRLSDQSTRIRYMKNKIDNKRGTFWNEQQNSIIKIKKDSNAQVYESGHSSSNIINYNSNINSIISNNSSNVISAISGLKTSNEKIKRLSIQLEDGIVLNFESQKQKQKQKDNKEDSSKMLRELQELRKQLQKQNQKFRSLQTENLHLKENIKFLSLKESRQMIVDRSQDNFNSTDFIQIRMPKKIQSPPVSKHPNIRLQAFQKSNQSDSTKQFLSNEKPGFGLNSFKKQFQSFECSSPSNARIEEQLKILKHKNIEGIFKKKQLKIEQKYEKTAQVFNKMLNDRLFSPKTFDVKTRQLQVKLEQQKAQIKTRIQQAKRVVGYIGDVSQSQQQNQQRQQDLDQAQANSLKIEVSSKPNQKNQSNVIDSFTNTSPLQQKPIQFAQNKNKKKQDPIIDDQDISQNQSSEQEKIYKKYWADDIQDVIKQSDQIKKRVDEAIRAQQSSQEHKTQNDKANPQEIYPVQIRQKQQKIDLQQKRENKQTSASPQTPKNTYQPTLEQPAQIEKKAQQIFNKINLNEQEECHSQQQDYAPPSDITVTRNQLQTNEPPTQNKKIQNLYISEIQFNKKKRKQEELSKSSSFDKQNKSNMSNSQIETKGFISNLTFIKQFCISICQFVRNHPQYKENFIIHLSETIQFDFQQYLKSYRTTIHGQTKNNYNTFQDQYLYPYFRIVATKTQPITKDLFVDFIKYYEQEKIENTTWNAVPLITRKVKQMRQIFMNSIIDAFNESLEYQRPGSIYGEPLPWLKQETALKNHKNSELKLLMLQKYNSQNSDKFDQYSDEQMKLDQIFGSSIAKIIQWGSCLCGFIADPNSMEMGDSGIANLSDSQLNSIRENRVGLMLQKWLLQEEQKITNSTAEYTEVLLALGEKIIEVLMLECTEELSEFQFDDIYQD